MINCVAKKQRVTDETSIGRKRMFLHIYIVFGLCFFGFTVVLGRAVYLHLVDNKNLKWVADKQYNAKIPVSLRRGKIYDRNGTEMAASLPVPSVYADPLLIEDPESTARQLSGILNIREKDLLAKFAGNRRFSWIKRRISYDVLKKVTGLNLPGINYIEESKRFYPNGELASQLLGAVGYDSQALAGMEMQYNDVLISKMRSTTYKRDARGKLYTSPVSFEEQSDVGDIYLTIDRQIQFFAEEALRRAVKDFSASDGVAVVMDPKSGDILAMANAPVFDPNRYANYPVASWRNRVVTDTFEPGSTFKVLVVAAALDMGIVNRESVFKCENGSIKIGKEILKDHHPYDNLPVEDIIKYSSNIGAMKVAFALGKENLFNALKKFGIGTSTDIDYPGEVGGTLRNHENWQQVEYATVAFGQGLTVTSLQMTAAFAAAVNGGLYYHPRLVARVVDKKGEVISGSRPETPTRAISGNASETMRYMLKRVVEKGGTGFNAFSDAYSIGGKTGTAQKVAGGKGYAKGRYFSSFMGFSTVEDPKIVVFVGLDEPKGSYYGGTVAAPAVKEIIEKSLHYMGVPSSTSQVLYTEKVVPSGSEAVQDDAKARVEFKEADKGKLIMPDLRGLTMREVLTATQSVDVAADTEGNGVVVTQNPAPYSIVGKGSRFSVKFELPR